MDFTYCFSLCFCCRCWCSWRTHRKP